MISYLLVQLTRMHASIDDRVKSIKVTNRFEADLNQNFFNMSDSLFMPSVEFNLMDSHTDWSDPDIDILQDGSDRSKGLRIDFNKLRSYISIQINFNSI